jgi:hypothetical protein
MATHHQSSLFLGEIRICGSPCLSVKHKRVNPGHSPGMLGRTGTMACSPGCHTTIVDLLKSALGNPRGLRNLRKRLHPRILGVEARCIRGPTSLHSLVCLEGCIRTRSLPTHLRSPCGILLAFPVLSCGQSTIVFQRPIHPYSFPPMDFW